MGFSSSLHGKAAHEALMSRQDAELRLMDLVRKCIVHKVRGDRDYGQALINVAHQGQKVERPDDLAGSVIAQAWRGMTEEIENLGKAIRLKADCLEKETLEKLNSLFSEKQKARKLYQEEHSRILAQFNQLSDEVAKKKAEYQKALETYKMTRNRFEEHYIKTGRGGRKVDDVRDKCQKACRKLHLTHNEYILLLSEATEFEQDFRTVLLPGLLESQQAIQESFVVAWRAALQEFARYMNLSGDTFAEIQARLVSCADKIRAADEYKDFTERKMSVASPVSFVFDISLVEDVSASLHPNSLVVDNLTIEELRNKQTEIEIALRVNQEKQATLLSSSPTAETNGTFPLENFRLAALDGVFRHNKSYSYDNREINELKSEAKRLNRQAEVIKAALSSLGCEDVPPGCELLDTSFIDGQDGLQGEEQPSPFGHKRNLGPQQRLANILRKPFRRKSVTTSPGSTRRFGDDDLVVGNGVGLGNGVGNVGNSNGLDLTAVSVRDRDGLREADVLVRTLADMENEDHDALCAEHVRTLIQRTPCFLLNNAMDCVMVPDTCNSVPALAPANTNTNTCLELTSLECDMDSAGNEAQPLSEEEWFHGVLPREEVVRLLTREGDFLVRETTRNDECQTVLSVCWGGHKHFIVQTTAEGQYRFEGPSFPTIGALINHQYESGLPVTSRSGAVLRHPIPRERWELNNDDIILGDKIGRGNFGDVYKATLKSGRQEVAVKTCRVTQEDHKKKFLQEGRILKQYDHPNVVKLIGIAVQKQPIMIVMELVPGGSLLTFLRNHGRTLTEKQLCGMCRDVAAGMQYLESKNCIHRDLAARNCLVGYENIVKISDFGMSREEEEYIVSDGMKQIPIKWTAPEALNFGKYTSLCDVWSYGILAWEIFSRGDIPYNGLSNSKAREKIDTGYRMPAPDGTPEEMYQLMLRCWEYDPERRPHFIQIYKAVDTLYSSFR